MAWCWPAAGLLARVYAPAADLAVAALGFVLLLTPTGSAPSPGWRRFGAATAAAMAVLAVAAAVAPGPLDAAVLSIQGPVGPPPSAAPCGPPTSWPWSWPSWPSSAGPPRW